MYSTLSFQVSFHWTHLHFFSELHLTITLIFNVLMDTICYYFKIFFPSTAAKVLGPSRRPKAWLGRGPHFVLRLALRHYSTSPVLAAPWPGRKPSLLLILLIRLFSVLSYCCVLHLLYTMWSLFLVISFLSVLGKFVYVFQPLHLY